MNIVGTVFPFSGSTTLQEGDKGQPVTELMQQSVSIEVLVRILRLMLHSATDSSALAAHTVRYYQRASLQEVQTNV